MIVGQMWSKIMFIEKLDNRLMCDMAIYGNDGHSHVAVDREKGVLHTEFHASGYCGHPGEKPGNVELITGTPGFIHSWYTPGKTVANDTTGAQYHFKTTKQQDDAVAEAMEAAGGIDPDSLGDDQRNEYHPGKGDFDEYQYGSWNCFSYTNRIFEAAYGNVFLDTYRWNQLQDQLNNFIKPRKYTVHELFFTAPWKF